MSTHVPNDVRTLSRERAAQFNTILKALQAEQIAAGQIWTTQSYLELPDGRVFQTDDPRVVVVLETFDLAEEVMPHVIAVPLSLETAMATDLDVILPQQISQLGFDCIAEIWNEVPVLVAQLKRYLGTLPAQVVDIMHDLATAKLLGEKPDLALAEWTGPALFGVRDSRYAFQQTEVAAVTYMTEASTAAIEFRVTAPAVSRRATTISSQTLVFRSRVTLAKLSRYLSSQRPTVAYAASAGQEEERYLIHQEGDETDFTLELLYRQRRPYPIYVEVHQAGSAIAGRRCTITVTTTAGSWTSTPTPLQVGATITIGEEPRFRIDDVQNVIVAVEE